MTRQLHTESRPLNKVAPRPTVASSVQNRGLEYQLSSHTRTEDATMQNGLTDGMSDDADILDLRCLVQIEETEIHHSTSRTDAIGISAPGSKTSTACDLGIVFHAALAYKGLHRGRRRLRSFRRTSHTSAHRAKKSRSTWRQHRQRHSHAHRLYKHSNTPVQALLCNKSGSCEGHLVGNHSLWKDTSRHYRRHHLFTSGMLPHGTRPPQDPPGCSLHARSSGSLRSRPLILTSGPPPHGTRPPQDLRPSSEKPSPWTSGQPMHVTRPPQKLPPLVYCMQQRCGEFWGERRGRMG